METNFEHYKDEMVKYWFLGIDRCEFKKKYILKTGSCRHLVCSECHPMVREWFDQQYEEPKIEIDWSKVPVDTPVIVTNKDGKELNRYFAKYNDGLMFTFDYGATSWSMREPNVYASAWTECRLAREEDIEKYRKE